MMLDLVTCTTIFQRGGSQPAGEIYNDSAFPLTTSALTSRKTVRAAEFYSDAEPRRTVPGIAERR